MDFWVAPGRESFKDTEQQASCANSQEMQRQIPPDLLADQEFGNSAEIQAKGESAGKDHTCIQVKPTEGSKGSNPPPAATWREHLIFLKPYMVSVTGVSVYRRLKPVLWNDAITAFSSWDAFKSTIKSRRVQYGFKFWLVNMALLLIVILMKNNYETSIQWNLHYAYITGVIISVQKIEAVVWKSVQRILGTLIGGTLAYLIMLRPYINSRGIAVATLTITSIFVIAHLLESRLKYTVFLTTLTLSSLTVCRFSSCCKPGEDFHNWVERVVNIIAACLFATGVSWMVLPWFASDSQLMLVADAYLSSARLMEDLYTTFQTTCKESAQGVEMGGNRDSYTTLSSRLDQEIAQPVELAVLGLRTEGVIWKKGFLSMPRIVVKLVEDMQDLIHHLTSLLLAVTSAPEEFGELSASIYRHFVLPLEEDNKTIVWQVKALADLCYTALKDGPSEENRGKIADMVHEFGVTRGKVRSHMDRLMKGRRAQRLSEQEVPSDRMTPADLLKLGSFLVAMSHCMDKVTLIARVIIDDSYGD